MLFLYRVKRRNDKWLERIFDFIKCTPMLFVYSVVNSEKILQSQLEDDRKWINYLLGEIVKLKGSE